MWVPGSLTEGETFLWYRPEPRLQLGLAFLWEQGAFRVLGNFVVIEETAQTPNLKVGAGVQGIGTGNPGYFATTEKNLDFSLGSLNVYAGLAFRANEGHGHPVGGFKVGSGHVSLGLQFDGHDGHPYVTHASGPLVLGFYLVGYERPGWLVGVRF